MLLPLAVFETWFCNRFAMFVVAYATLSAHPGVHAARQMTCQAWLHQCIMVNAFAAHPSILQ